MASFPQKKLQRFAAPSLVVLLSLSFGINPPAVRAGVVVVANRTRESIAVRILPKGLETGHETSAGETRQQRARAMTIESGRQLVLRGEDPCQLLYDVSGELVRYQLDANSVYFFSLDDQGWLDLSRVDLGGDPPTATQPPHQRVLAADQLAVLPIKILVDNHDPTRRNVWEARLRKRIDGVSKILQQHCRLKLEIVAADTWDSGNKKLGFSQILADFRAKVDPAPGCLAIGFTGRYAEESGRVDLGVTQGMLQSHILIREWAASMSEPERAEVLLHEIGHYLGAVHSPDSSSVMRPVLADSKAVHRSFEVGFDPVNTLIINLVADEIRARPAVSLSSLSPAVRRRLTQVYGALYKATPGDKSIRQYLSQLTMAGESPLIYATRLVVREVRRSAQSQHAAEKQASTKRSTDQLTELYVRRAAIAAKKLPGDLAPVAFVLGLGIGLDDSNTLLRNPITETFCRKVETEAERRARQRTLGSPTLRGRRDLAQHFFLSAYLTAVVGARATETAGWAKELADARSKSGFSYRDLAADVAGIDFAQRLLDGDLSLAEVARGLATGDLMPHVADLPEGVPWSEISPKLTSQDNQSATHYRTMIRRRVRQLSDPPVAPPTRTR